MFNSRGVEISDCQFGDSLRQEVGRPGVIQLVARF